MKRKDEWQTIVINNKNYHIRLKDVERILKKHRCGYKGINPPTLCFTCNGKSVPYVELDAEGENGKGYCIRLLTDKVFYCKNELGLAVDESFLEEQRREARKLLECNEGDNRCSFEVENVGYICLSHVGLYIVASVHDKSYSDYDEVMIYPKCAKNPQPSPEEVAIIQEVCDRIQTIKKELQTRKCQLNLDRLRKDDCTIELYGNSMKGAFIVDKSGKEVTPISTVKELVSFLTSNKYTK